MTAGRWQRVREILYTASQIDHAERARYVAEQCGDDTALRSEVEDLLDALQASGGFLDSPLPIMQNLAQYIAETSQKHIGRRLGPYELLEEIGHGGMGEVYRARRIDGQFEKEVAVKLVRGGWDSTFIGARFRQERHVLARLEHPNIARLLDGGTTDEGIPYLVMELIEGTPIDEYCDQHALTITARLRLFDQVCTAVQYAHQRLVIHRDLKPGNILVTTDGVPKLLDFGIAKIMDPSGGSTTTQLLPLTPEYASPEQLRGEPVTTASDVYSLGIVLYVLLTGRSPYDVDRRNLADLAFAATETEPERPSDAVGRKGDADHKAGPGSAKEKLRRRLRGDLDTIVLKALRKEPQHRYSSVEQFAEDIRREMEGLPVRARRGSWSYRAGKFLRRHKVGMAAAGIAGLAILGGVAATVREARIAAANEHTAEKRFNNVRALATSNLLELNDALEKLPASAPARHLLIQRSLESLDQLREDASDNRDLMRQIARGYERIGELQGRFTGAGVGDVNSSVASYRKALAIRSRLTEISHHAPEEIISEVNTLGNFTRTLLIYGRLGEALQTARTGLALSGPLANSRPKDQQPLLAFANANVWLAAALAGDGSSPNRRAFDEAVARDLDAIEILRHLNAADPKIHLRTAVAQLLLGMHYWKSRAFGKSLEILDGILANNTTQSAGPVLILRVQNWRGHVFVSLGDHRNALQAYKQGLGLARSIAAAQPDDMDARLDRDILTGLTAIEEARLGDPRIALKHLNEALTSIEQMFARNPELFYQRILLVGYSFRGEILSLLGNQTEARTELLRSLGIAEGLARNEPMDLDSQLQIARAHAALGVLWARSVRLTEARNELGSSILAAKQLQASRPGDQEATNLARTTEDQLSALARCSETKPCASAEQLQLPSLIE